MTQPLMRPRRPTCPRCQRPLRTCLCALVQPTLHRTDVLVLQHPLEQSEAKNSVALLRLSLAHCRVVVGDRFDDATLCALLRPPGRQVRLLYPDVPAVPAPPAPALNPAEPLRLLVIDATWRKSLRMLLEHPLLAALPRLTLTTPEPTRYRALRAACNPEQLSTLEATVHALATLEGAAKSTLGKLQHDLDALHGKVVHAAKRKDETTSRRESEHEIGDREVATSDTTIEQEQQQLGHHDPFDGANAPILFGKLRVRAIQRGEHRPVHRYASLVLPHPCASLPSVGRDPAPRGRL